MQVVPLVFCDFFGFIKNLSARARDLRDPGLIPGSGRSSGGGNDNLLWYSCLENSMDRGAWRATVQGQQRGGHDRMCTQLTVDIIIISIINYEYHAIMVLITDFF